jgi:hypothetical protein
VSKKIELEIEACVKLLAELQYIIVSLDKIGSAELSAAARRLEIERFVIHGEVFSRLTSMRRTLGDALDKSVSVEEMELIEDGLEKTTPWKVQDFTT